MEFTIADGAVGAVLLLSGLLAWSRGFTREALAIGGWILAGIAAVYAAPIAEPILQEIPVMGPFMQGSCAISKFIAFAVVFALGLIVISIFTPLFASAVEESPLGVIDKGLGFLFGLARGLALVAIAYVIYSYVVAGSGDPIPAIENAQSLSLIREVTDQFVAAMPRERAKSWIAGPFESLMGECGGFGLSAAPGSAA